MGRSGIQPDSVSDGVAVKYPGEVCDDRAVCVSVLSVCSGVNVIEITRLNSKGMHGGCIIILSLYAVRGLYVSGL